MKFVEVPRCEFSVGDFVNHCFSGSQVFVVVCVRYDFASSSFFIDIATLDGSVLNGVRESNLIRCSCFFSGSRFYKKGDQCSCVFFPGKKFFIKRLESSAKRVFLAPSSGSDSRIGFWCCFSDLRGSS